MRLSCFVFVNVSLRNFRNNKTTENLAIYDKKNLEQSELNEQSSTQCYGKVEK